MKTDQQISDWLDEQSIDAIIPDGYPSAFIGVTEEEPPRTIYSLEGVLKVLMERDGMSRESALEFFEHNIGGAHIEGGPIFILMP